MTDSLGIRARSARMALIRSKGSRLELSLRGALARQESEAFAATVSNYLGGLILF